LQVAVLVPGATLAAVRLELPCQHTKRNARAAAIAIGPVREHSTAPESAGHEIRIRVVVDEMAGRRDLGAGLRARQVTARVRRRRIELQGLERKVLEVRHAGSRGRISRQYTGAKRQTGAGSPVFFATVATK